ncbi:MAG: energy transducer TonB, partial [Pseudomonadota bacterium]
FEINAGGKGTGGSFLAADQENFYVHTRQKGTRAFKLEDGVKKAFRPNEPVLIDGKIYSAETKDEQPVVRCYNGGTARVGFTVTANGGVSGVSIIRSSGNRKVDSVAMSQVKRAAPFPKPPSGAQRRFVVPIMVRR